MKYRVDTPGYRNGGFVEFEASSKKEAEIKAKEILTKFPSVTEIVISKVVTSLNDEVTKEKTIIWR